jgi:putative spermidine/putrescine transport system permease protein
MVSDQSLLQGVAQRALVTKQSRLVRVVARPEYLLLLPGAALLGASFFYPVISLIKTSFTDPKPGLGNYTALFSDPSATHALIRTVVAALIISVCCLIVAYPYAYVMTVVRPGIRTAMLVVVSLPFWTSLIARTFAWLILEERGGLLEHAMSVFGLHYVLLGTLPGVVIAMVQILLAYMVFPLYSVMSTIDRRLLHAAHVCGASRTYAFFRVFVPLSLPGISAGVSLVFLLTLGFYVTPVLLGSSQDALVGQVIGVQVGQLFDFPAASAYSVILLVIMLLMLGLLLRGIRLSTAGRASRGGQQA